MKIHTLLAALALTAAGGAVFAQTPKPADPLATPIIDQRQVNQQQRIDQGVSSGQLTAQETNRLDKLEAKIAADEAKAKSDGKVTRAERRKLLREEDHASRAIYRQKHDRQVARTTTK